MDPIYPGTLQIPMRQIFFSSVVVFYSRVFRPARRVWASSRNSCLRKLFCISLSGFQNTTEGSAGFSTGAGHNAAIVRRRGQSSGQQQRKNQSHMAASEGPHLVKSNRIKMYPRHCHSLCCIPPTWQWAADIGGMAGSTGMRTVCPPIPAVSGVFLHLGGGAPGPCG